MREPAEVAEIKIPEAICLPMSHVGMDEYPDFGAQKITVICHSGVRSARVTAALTKGGRIEVYNLKGGIVAWINAGMPAIFERC